MLSLDTSIVKIACLTQIYDKDTFFVKNLKNYKFLL